MSTTNSLINNFEQQQLESLQQTLNRAYQRVNFYRNALDKKGIKPEQIEKLSDLSLLPFTTREDLHKNYPYDFFAVPLRDIVRLHTLKMPFENPIVLGYTKSDIESRKLLISEILSASNITQDDIIQIYLEKGMSVWGSELKEGAEHLGALTIPSDPININELLMVMRDFKATILITTPSEMKNILHEIEKNKIPPAGISLKKVLLIGEKLDETLRQKLKENLSINALSLYGLIELGGPCAFECEAQNGLHIAMDYFIPEIIDPNTGNNLPPGEEGELVLTTLKSKANPIIRFRTGDITSILMDKCPCGRKEIMIKPVTKTCDSRINIKGIKINPIVIYKLLLKYNMQNTRYIFVIRDLGHKKEPEIWIVMDENNFSGSLPQLHNLLVILERDFEDIFGFSCKIRPVEPSVLDSLQPNESGYLEIREDI